MTRTTFSRLTVLYFILLASACVPVSNTIRSKSLSNSMDVTMGSYSSKQAEKLILVTMHSKVHQQLVQGESISREEKLPVLYATFLSDLARRYGIRRVADWPISSLDIRCLVFEINEPANRSNIIDRLNKDPNIETAQPLQLFQPLLNDLPVYAQPSDADNTRANSIASHYNDPYLKMQHGFKTMQVEPSHQWATGVGVKIAVIDTGLDTEHLDLLDRMIVTRNFVDRNMRQFNRDVHGTAVAGIIAASGNNGTGVVGVAPEAGILGLKACWQEIPGSGDTGTAYCNSFTLAKALNYSIEQQVDIINLSLGGPRDPLLERLVETALKKNILVIGAVHPDQPQNFPASVTGVIAVGETGHKYSPRYRSIGKAVKAPGEKVLSTRPGNEYDFYSGSSLSTAHISGLAALIRQRKPHLSAENVHDLIATTTVAQSNSANACRVLALLVGVSRCPE